MDKKAEVVEEERSFKKMSVLPTEKDFVDAILSLKDLETTYVFRKARVSTFKFNRVRMCYVEKVKFVQKTFLRKLDKVSHEFHDCLSQASPLYDCLLYQRFDRRDFARAQYELFHATSLTHNIGMGYSILLKKDDCNSLEKCKSLTVAALGFMFTVAMRSIPCLDYLEKVRQFMAQATEKDILEDENVVTRSLRNKNTKHFVALFTEEDCTLPPFLDIQDVAGFVPPETLRWLEELEREEGFNLQHYQPDNCAKLAHQLLSLPLAG